MVAVATECALGDALDGLLAALDDTRMSYLEDLDAPPDSPRRTALVAALQGILPQLLETP